MIKIKGIKAKDTEIKISFTSQVKTYNIISGFMSDECKPYRVAQSVMIWINGDGYIGEIECIYPTNVNKTQCNYSEKVNQINGLPIIEIYSCDNEAFIQHFEGGFILWLSKDKFINTEVSFKDLTFLLSGKELVAIKANHTIIID